MRLQPFRKLSSTVIEEGEKRNKHSKVASPEQWAREAPLTNKKANTCTVQPLSRKSRTPTVPKKFQIVLYNPAEADLNHLRNCCSEGLLGEQLYIK